MHFPLPVCLSVVVVWDDFHLVFILKHNVIFSAEVRVKGGLMAVVVRDCGGLKGTEFIELAFHLALFSASSALSPRLHPQSFFCQKISDEFF